MSVKVAMYQQDTGALSFCQPGAKREVSQIRETVGKRKAHLHCYKHTAYVTCRSCAQAKLLSKTLYVLCHYPQALNAAWLH